MKARIRDFLETVDGWIFAVADYSHPNGIRCLLRYVPDPNGERQANGKRYTKLDFDESYEFLRKHRPNYVHDLHVVPEKDILRLYQPSVELPRICKTDSRLNAIVTVLREGGVPMDAMGITGSMLIGTNGSSSDIDFVVYGNWWWKARDLISKAKAKGQIEDLGLEMWQRIYSKRRPEISFDEFVLHEARKGNRGVIGGTYFDLLFTRDWPQVESYVHLPGKVVGKKRIKAKVIDSSMAFDSPSVFKLDSEVKELLCFSHTYAGQAMTGEVLEAQGVLEETDSGLRLVVGTTREARGEWIRSLTLCSSSKGSSSKSSSSEVSSKVDVCDV